MAATPLARQAQSMIDPHVATKKSFWASLLTLPRRIAGWWNREHTYHPPDITLKGVLQAVQVAVFISDSSGKFMDINDAFVSFHRCRSKDEFRMAITNCGSIFDIFAASGEKLHHGDWAISRALRGETATNVECNFRRKDTGESWVGSYSFAPIRSAEGQIVGSVVTAEDITAKKLAEEQLRNTSSRLHLALSSAHLGVWDWDVSNNNMNWDDRMLELYGLGRSGFPNDVSGWEAPLHPEDRARAVEDVQAALRGDRDFDTEFRVVHPDGKVLYLKANGLVLRAADGSPTRMLGVNADITEEKRSQEQLQRAYAEIEAKVVERTAELEAAKVAAENANRAKDLFLATLSHELRTPLSAILSWSQLLERGGLPPEKMQIGIRTIKENVWSQNQLISDLLDISRIVTGKLTVDRQPVNPQEVTSAAVETIRAGAELRGIVIEERYTSPDSYILADAARLKQVLWNILSNAMKFTPAGGRITVSLDTCDGPNPTARISVRDTGKGIKPEFLPLLFERFSQADPSSSRMHGGMGLGLSLVKSLVELQGGSVSAESPGEGLGATFLVTFPCITAAEQLTRAERAHSRAPIETVPSLSHLKILLVEDTDKTRVALQEILNSQGAEVYAVSSAAEAMRQLSSLRPDIIVSDIAMPEENGHTLIRKVRALGHERGGDVPAIALTAYSDPRDRDEALSSGFQDYLSKPVDAGTLARAIVKLRQQPHQSPPAH